MRLVVICCAVFQGPELTIATSTRGAKNHTYRSCKEHNDCKQRRLKQECQQQWMNNHDFNKIILL